MPRASSVLRWREGIEGIQSLLSIPMPPGTMAITAEGCHRREKGSALSSRWLARWASAPEAELRKSTATMQAGRSLVKLSAAERGPGERGARPAAGVRSPAWQKHRYRVCMLGQPLRSVRLRSMIHAKCEILAGSVRSTRLLHHDSRSQALRPQPACSGAPAPSYKNKPLKGASSKKQNTSTSRARTKKQQQKAQATLRKAAALARAAFCTITWQMARNGCVHHDMARGPLSLYPMGAL